MSSALKFAAHNVVHGGWYKGNTRAYLSSCAIPERVVDRLYHHLGRLEDSEDTDKATELFEAAAPNVIRQTIVPMFTWIEAGMHHVFHGVVARIMLLMEEVFASEDKKTPFEDLINPYLLGIEELRLDWLHVKTLPKTQWLAEDELGFSRILTFAYGQFFLNIKLKETTNITQGALLSMRQMLIALNVMVALLMSPTDPNVDVIDGHIKVFCRVATDSQCFTSTGVRNHSGRPHVTFLLSSIFRHKSVSLGPFGGTGRVLGSDTSKR